MTGWAAIPHLFGKIAPKGKQGQYHDAAVWIQEDDRIMNVQFRIKEDGRLYLRLLWKKFRDMKLTTKIRIFMFSAVTVSCTVIGLWSYHYASDAVIGNSETMMIDLMKQSGLNLDERISAFRNSTYQILQTDSIRVILSYSHEEAQEHKATSSQDFTQAVLQEDYLYNYIDYGFLFSKAGDITSHYHAGVEKLDTAVQQEILEAVSDCVSVTKPYRWFLLGEELYFVRLSTDGEGSEEGILCLHMNESFLTFVGTDNELLENDNIVIVDNENDIICNELDWLDNDRLMSFVSYHDETYYIYSRSILGDSGRFVMVALNTPVNDWTIVGFIPYDSLLETVNHIFAAILIVVVIVLAMALLITAGISRTMTANILAIEGGMRQYEEGNFDARIKPVYYDEIGLLALQFNHMGMRISDLLERLEKEQDEKREAKYQTLQAQINPHFLYNILGSLKWSCYRRGEKETASVIDAIISLLRFTIKRTDKIVPLTEEIEYIRNYIAIEKMRTGNSFVMQYEIEEATEQMELPGFILQPFVENALVHGLDTSKEDAMLVIRARFDAVDAGRLILEVEDNGVGMEPDQIRSLLEDEAEVEEYHGFTSVGIRIVRARLRNYYGSDFQLKIDSEPGEGTRVTIELGELHGQTE